MRFASIFLSGAIVGGLALGASAADEPVHVVQLGKSKSGPSTQQLADWLGVNYLSYDAAFKEPTLFEFSVDVWEDGILKRSSAGGVSVVQSPADLTIFWRETDKHLVFKFVTGEMFSESAPIKFDRPTKPLVIARGRNENAKLVAGERTALYCTCIGDMNIGSPDMGDPKPMCKKSDLAFVLYCTPRRVK